ncbi:helix-turn-helix transcriptional regulator [Alkalibacillus almallahensis]|uniref:helix-turn-helix transcriptional regulator n=1 Tax=Alkalibacillus almallahensis TaxID=1379154 RepID=UPI0014225056|nr:helix-turn-helix transcriptional regulator [Alkalibacillus almallahensis]NIK12838.1 transcriptional regulator with XRE-family HTH domain [Alkalibacillus almallahensis]
MAQGRGRSAKRLREARKEKGQTQLQLSLDTYQSRESVTKQENEEFRVQPHLAKYFTEEYNDPRVAIEAAHEYTGWGTPWLDGAAFDDHRASVLLQTKREVQEALDKIDDVNVAKNPNTIAEYERSEIRDLLVESAEAMTFIKQEIAIMCKDYRFDWMELWDEVNNRLKSRQYIK